MIAKLLKSLEEKERAWRYSFGNDISTPAKRREARRHMDWVDHGILRRLWWNFHPVAMGVFRSNQPPPERIAKYRDRGIRSVLNLRGDSIHGYYLFEAEACAAHGIGLTNINLSPNELPSLDTLLTLDRHFQELQKPLVIHCKSGADRAGFASALYLLLIEGAPIELAQRQLGLKYLHIRSSSKGILDYCLETYRETNQRSPIPFRDWMMTMYDPAALTAAFQARRARKGV